MPNEIIPKMHSHWRLFNVEYTTSDNKKVAVIPEVQAEIISLHAGVGVEYTEDGEPYCLFFSWPRWTRLTKQRIP